MQARILHLLRDLLGDFGMATILITLRFGGIAGFCREVIVLYSGQIMEQASVEPVLAAPTRPYSRGLLHALPRVDQDGAELNSIPGSPPNMMRAP